MVRRLQLCGVTFKPFIAACNTAVEKTVGGREPPSSIRPRIWSHRLHAFPAQQRDDEKHEEQYRQNLGDGGRKAGQCSEPEKRREKRYEQKYNSIVQHKSSLSFAATHDTKQSDGCSRYSADQHPHGFVRGMAGEKTRDVRTERVAGIDSEDGEHNAADD